MDGGGDAAGGSAGIPREARGAGRAGCDHDPPRGRRRRGRTRSGLCSFGKPAARGPWSGRSAAEARASDGGHACRAKGAARRHCVRMSRGCGRGGSDGSAGDGREPRGHGRRPVAAACRRSAATIGLASVSGHRCARARYAGRGLDSSSRIAAGPVDVCGHR